MNAATTVIAQTGRKMKLIALVMLAVLPAVGGCAKTVGPVEFLSLYRRSSSMMNTSSGHRAIYEGRDGQYHYLTIRRSTLQEGGMAMLVWGAYRDEKLRCLLEYLPQEFPEGFDLLISEPGDEARTETPQETDRYVRRYLSERNRPAPPSKER